MNVVQSKFYAGLVQQYQLQFALKQLLKFIYRMNRLIFIWLALESQLSFLSATIVG